MNTANSNHTHDVAAIISAFNPPAPLIEAVSQLRRLVDLVIVVDDGSSSDPHDVLSQLEKNGITLLRLGANKGIAFALNAGVVEARRLGNPRFYLTLDQDSILDQNYITNALSTYTQASASGIDVGFIGASSYNGVPVLLETPIAGFATPFDPWQSGMVIPAETFDAVGGFAEEFFIDAVDTEFTMRVRSRGLHALVGSDCNVMHTIGELRTPTLLGKRVTFGGKLKTYSAHSPTRVYYMSRNGVLLGMKYFQRFPLLLSRKAYYEVKNHSVRIIFGSHRTKLILALISGLAHGLLGRTGRLGRRLENLLS
jgi:rhamnosyltransferase